MIVKMHAVSGNPFEQPRYKQGIPGAKRRSNSHNIWACGRSTSSCQSLLVSFMSTWASHPLPDGFTVALQPSRPEIKIWLFESMRQHSSSTLKLVPHQTHFTHLSNTASAGGANLFIRPCKKCACYDVGHAFVNGTIGARSGMSLKTAWHAT